MRALRSLRWPTVVVVAAVVRLVSWSVAAPDNPAMNPFDGDCHYHRLRAEQIVGDFPRVNWRDPDLGGGIDIPWPPLFDEVIALGALAIGAGEPSRADVALAAAWIPVVVGVATVPLVGWLASLLAGPGMALGAGTVLALSTSHVMFSLLGRSDQHVLELLLLVVLLAAYAKGMAAEGMWAWAAAVLATGTAIAAAFWNWLGSALNLLFLVSYVAGWHVLCPRGGPRAMAPSAMLALGGGAGAIVLALTVALLAPAGALTSGSILGVTGLHVALTAATAAFGALIWVARRLAPDEGRLRRALEVLVAGVLPILLAASHPGLREGIGRGLTALLRGNRWYSSIAEFAPLVLGGGAPVWRELGEALAWYGLVPLAGAFGARALIDRWRRAPDRSPELLLLLIWGAASFVLALAQHRFSLYAAAPLAIWAWAGVQSARERWVPRRCRDTVLQVAVALVLLSPAASVAKAYLLTSPGVSPGPLLAWLEDQPDATSSRTVYARWSWGHHVRAIARQPAVANPFGTEGGASAFEESLRTFLSADEDEFLRVLEANDAAYLLNENPRGDLVYQAVRPTGMPALAEVRSGWRRGLEVRETEHARGLVTYRLYDHDGSSARGLPALGSFRLLRETEPVERAKSVRPAFALYGVVPGARLAVRGACSGEEVTAATVVRSNTGREFAWLTKARADDGGTVVLRVPYATGLNGSSVASAFEVAACARSRAVVVAEGAVVGGGTIEVALHPAPFTPAAATR